jgi:hypothetical protein
MIAFELKTHRPEVEYKWKHHFFILTKGLNSGKPLREPCANCFVCISPNFQEKENLFWILFALWQGKRFHPVLVGSVIPFVRKKDLHELILEGLLSKNKAPEEFIKTIKILTDLQHKEQQFKRLVLSIKDLKCALVNDMLRW